MALSTNQFYEAYMIMMERSCNGGCSEKGVSRNSNSDVIICCCVETLMVRYYLGVCECMLTHASVCEYIYVCVCVAWVCVGVCGGLCVCLLERERKREKEREREREKYSQLSNFAICN